MSMVEYIKEILTKVSFDNELFMKELHKSRRWLTPEEWNTVLQWANRFHKDKLLTDNNNKVLTFWDQNKP